MKYRIFKWRNKFADGPGVWTYSLVRQGTSLQDDIDEFEAINDANWHWAEHFRGTETKVCKKVPAKVRTGMQKHQLYLIEAARRKLKAVMELEVLK
jgi:hypothetical protein